MDGSGLEGAYQGKNQGDMLNIVQVERGKAVEINTERDNLLTEFGKATLEDRYLMPNETPQDLFARVAAILLMMTLMHKEFMIIFQGYGLCLQRPYFRMEALKEDCQFHVF